MLRGDFFCLPFGQGHPPHGETANADWSFVGRQTEGDRASLALSLRPKARPGTVLKTIWLLAGHNALYIRHELSGFSGRMCYSHHAILEVPEQAGSLRLSTSSFRLGMAAPRDELANAGDEYYSLQPGVRFSRLDRVPTIWNTREDCTTFPRRYGFMDLAALYAGTGEFPAWTSAAVPSRGYLWYALKDAVVLPQLLLWMDNGGRHAFPWDGRNRCLGLEDGCAFFDKGLSASAKANPVARQGIPTSVLLSPRRPTAINYIQGVARIPAGFDRVKSASFTPGKVSFLAESGKKASAAVDWEFLRAGLPLSRR